jgi:hypothetical protein
MLIAFDTEFILPDRLLELTPTIPLLDMLPDKLLELVPDTITNEFKSEISFAELTFKLSTEIFNALIPGDTRLPDISKEFTTRLLMNPVTDADTVFRLASPPTDNESNVPTVCKLLDVIPAPSVSLDNTVVPEILNTEFEVPAFIRVVPRRNTLLPDTATSIWPTSPVILLPPVLPIINSVICIVLFT